MILCRFKLILCMCSLAVVSVMNFAETQKIWGLYNQYFKYFNGLSTMQESCTYLTGLKWPAGRLLPWAESRRGNAKVLNSEMRL